MCGGFNCTRNALTALNVLYIIVSLILVGVAAYGRVASIVSSVTVITGIIVCGGLLFFLSLVGLVGARKHHQVLLFFYMTLLFVLFVVQFSIACACLAVSEAHQEDIARSGWNQANDEVRIDAQHIFQCCGYESHSNSTNLVLCFKSNLACCRDSQNCKCPPCEPKVKKAIESGLNISGTIGLFFSLTEFVGVWLTVRYRNLKNPRADPSAFL